MDGMSPIRAEIKGSGLAKMASTVPSEESHLVWKVCLNVLSAQFKIACISLRCRMLTRIVVELVDSINHVLVTL